MVRKIGFIIIAIISLYESESPEGVFGSLSG